MTVSEQLRDEIKQGILKLLDNRELAISEIVIRICKLLREQEAAIDRIKRSEDFIQQLAGKIPPVVQTQESINSKTKTNGTVELLEFVQAAPGMVDRDGGVIHNVKIIGSRSKNNRIYPLPALRKAAGLYENRPVHVSHPNRSNADAERSFDDRIGWLSNVRLTGNSLFGDLHVLKSDPRSGKIFEAAERNPTLFGLSHNAEGKVTRKGDGLIVEEITRVRSVDVVTDPASTNSLFESQDVPARCDNKMTAKEFAKRLKGEPVLSDKDSKDFAKKLKS